MDGVRIGNRLRGAKKKGTESRRVTSPYSGWVQALLSIISLAVQALTRANSALRDTTCYFAANATTEKEKTCKLPRQKHHHFCAGRFR